MNVEIRAFRESDRAAVIALWDDVFAADPAHNVAAQMIERKLRVQPDIFGCDR